MNTMAMHNPQVITVKAANPYREQFKACLWSWNVGLLTGIPLSAALSFLFSGFQFDVMFFVMLPLTMIASML